MRQSSGGGATRRHTAAGALLRDARLRAGLTQVELAEWSGVVRPLISQYENGRKDPSVTMLARLIEACGMELRMRAEVMSDAERLERAGEALAISTGQARRNADRARREVVSVRRLTAAELDRLRRGGRAAS